MVQDAEHGFDDGGRVGEAAAAGHAAGEIAAVGSNDLDVARGEDFEIGLGGRMLPHVDVHGGRDDDGRGGGEIEGGEEIVGDAVREFREDVGGGRCDDEQVGGLRGVDVLDGGVEVAVGGFGRGPEAGDDLLSGERGEGERLDELPGCLGHDYVDIERVLLERTDQFCRLVSGDSAGDADCDLHA